MSIIFNAIRKIVYLTLLLFFIPIILVSLLFIYEYFFAIKIIEKSYYEVSAVWTIEDGLKKSSIKELYLTYPSIMVIELESPDSSLYLEKIEITHKDRVVGGIDIGERLSTNLYDTEYRYSMEGELLRIFGVENEKFNVSSDRYMEEGFFCEIIIRNRESQEEYRYKTEMKILYVKKGKARKKSLTDLI